MRSPGLEDTLSVVVAAALSVAVAAVVLRQGLVLYSWLTWYLLCSPG